VSEAEAAARALATRTGAVVAVTGPVDFLTDGARAARVTGGDALMPRVTALGCALTCLIGGFAAVVEDPFDATLAALCMFAAAGEAAGDNADGPGSFAWQFLDALAAVEPAWIGAGRVHPL
jgi:hydroxyethylthiazole kinase